MCIFYLIKQMRKASQTSNNKSNQRKIVLKATVQTRYLTSSAKELRPASHNKELEVISPLSPPNNGEPGSKPKLVPHARPTKKIPGATTAGTSGNRRIEELAKAKFASAEVRMKTIQTPQAGTRNALAESKLSNNSSTSKPKPGTIKRRVDMSEPRRQYYKTTGEQTSVGKIRKNVGQSQPSALVEKSIAEDAALNLSSIDRGSDGLTRQEMSGPDPVVNLNEGIQFLQKNLKALEGKYKDLAKFYGNERTQPSKEDDPPSSSLSPKDTNKKRASILNDLAEQDSAITRAKHQSEQALQDLSQAMNQVSVLVLGAEHTLYTSLTQAKESLSGQLNQLDKIASVSQSLALKVQEESSSVLEALFHRDFTQQLEEQKQSSQRQMQQMEKTMTELRMQNADLRSKIESSAKDIKSKQNSNLQASQKVQELQSLLQTKEQDLISLADSTKNFLMNLRQVQRSVQRGGSESLVSDKAQFNQSKRDLERLLSNVSGSEQISVDLEESGELSRLKRELSDIQAQHQQAVGQHCVTLKNVKNQLLKLDQQNQRRGTDVARSVLEMQKRIENAAVKQKQLRSVIATLKHQCHLSGKALQAKEKEIRQLSTRLAHQTAQVAQHSAQSDSLKQENTDLKKQVDELLESQQAQLVPPADAAAQEQLEVQRLTYEQRLNDVQSELKLQLAKLQQDNERLNTECDLARAELQSQLAHAVKLKQEMQQQKHEQANEILKASQKQAEELAASHRQQLADLRQESALSQEKLTLAHSHQLDKLNRTQQDELKQKLPQQEKDLRAKFSQQLEQVAAQADEANQTKVQDEMQLIQLQNQVDALQGDLEQAHDNCAKLESESKAECKRHAELQQHLETQLADLQQQSAEAARKHTTRVELLEQSHKLDLEQAKARQQQSDDTQTQEVAALQNQLFEQSTQQRALTDEVHVSRQAQVELKQRMAELEDDVQASEAQLASAKEELAEEQTRSAALEQTLEHNLGLTQQLKESLQKALDKSKAYKRECHEVRIERAELEKHLVQGKANLKQLQTKVSGWGDAVRELRSQQCEVQKAVREQSALERGAYAEFAQFVCQQIEQLEKQRQIQSQRCAEEDNQQHEQHKQLHQELSSLQATLAAKTENLRRLDEQYRASQEELMAKNELIEEANNFIVEYTEEKHELKAKFKVLVGGLLCDQTVSSYKSTDQVDIDKCFELIEQTLLERSMRAGEGAPLQSRLLNELAQVLPAQEVQNQRRLAGDHCQTTAAVCSTGMGVRKKYEQFVGKVKTKLEQARGQIQFQREQLKQLNTVVSQGRIREAAYKEQFQSEKQALLKEQEELVMKLAQSEVQCEQEEEQHAQAVALLEQQKNQLQQKVLDLQQDKLDLQTELAQQPRQPPHQQEESLLSDQEVKELREENAQLLQRLLKCQTKLQEATPNAQVDVSEFEAKLDSLRKQLITLTAALRQEMQQKMESEVQEIRQAYVENRILKHNVLQPQRAQSWNSSLSCVEQLEINQKVYYLLQQHEEEESETFWLVLGDELEEEQLLYLRSFAATHGQVIQLDDPALQQAQEQIQELTRDLLELRQDFQQYANRVQVECQVEKNEVALQDEVEYLHGENKDLQLKLKEVCVANAQLRAQVASHLMQDVTDHDLRHVLEKEEPNSFMSDHDSFIVEALNSDSRTHNKNKDQLEESCASEQTTIEHIKATLLIFLQRVPPTDPKNEELLNIISSMMAFSKSEVAELAKQRQLLLKPQLKGSSSAQALSAHNSQEDQSVKSETHTDNKIKKGLKSFFKTAVGKNDSGKLIQAPSPVKK